MSQNVSKSREANELRAKARAVLAEISDTSQPLTGEEFTAKKAEFDALTARAQFLADHTPDAEIARQGGDAELVRVDAEGADALPPNAKDQMAHLHKVVRAAFGGTANYCRAARGMLGNLTSKQEAALALAKETTRTIVGTASDASGGEFLLPLEQEASVFRVDNTIQGILQRARMYSMRGRTKRIPYLVQDNNEITRPLSSISAITIVGEASTKPTREPVWGQRVLTAYKYAAVSKVADEMLDDDFTGDLEPSMIQVVGQEIVNQINYDLTINGSGSGAPTGALHTSANTALLKVTRQTQNRIKAADLFNMYVQHTHGPSSFWLVSRRAVAEVFNMELSTGSGTTFLANLVTDPMKATILGYPVVVSDFLNTMGAEGDLALVNPEHYAAAMRRQLTVESSIHVGFVDDYTTWRFFARAAGIPIPTSPYAYRSAASANVDEHSPFVVLDDVYV